MKNKILYILYIFMAICGCIEEKDGKIHVDLDESTVFDWDNRIDIVEAIPLNAPLNGSSNRFEKCIVSDKSILCYDRIRKTISVLMLVENYYMRLSHLLPASRDILK